jgi:DNA polymerase epsilon subunit 2
VFVPGPDDAGLGGVLPQPPLPKYLTAEVQRVLPGAVFATNPCRSGAGWWWC